MDIGRQAPSPPHPGGFRIYRDRSGTPRWFQRFVEAWWIVTGRWSLHRAWQNGLDYGSMQEWRRMRAGGK